jgi:hypothetical protein
MGIACSGARQAQPFSDSPLLPRAAEVA